MHDHAELVDPAQLHRTVPAMTRTVDRTYYWSVIDPHGRELKQVDIETNSHHHAISRMLDTAAATAYCAFDSDHKSRECLIDWMSTKGNGGRLSVTVSDVSEEPEPRDDPRDAAAAEAIVDKKDAPEGRWKAQREAETAARDAIPEGCVFSGHYHMHVRNPHTNETHSNDIVRASESAVRRSMQGPLVDFTPAAKVRALYFLAGSDKLKWTDWVRVRPEE